MGEWESLEIAPKDGSTLLLASGKYPDVKVDFGHFCGYRGYWTGWCTRHKEFVRYTDVFAWQEIPKAPDASTLDLLEYAIDRLRGRKPERNEAVQVLSGELDRYRSVR